MLWDILQLSGEPCSFWISRCTLLPMTTRGGDLTNSDLEQAGILTHADVAASLYDLQELTLLTLNDNSAAIFHNWKGAITSNQAAAYLCHLWSTATATKSPTSKA